jgi:peroxiredoxin
MKALSLFLFPFLLLLGPQNQKSAETGILPEGTASSAAVSPDSLKNGDEAPMFVLRDLKTDNAVYLRDYTGKTLRKASNQRYVVVLSFWSTWCQPCKEEIPHLTKIAGEFAGKPLKIFLISTMEWQSTTEDSVRSVYASRGYTLQCLLDATGRIAMRYGARALPMVVVIDKQGIVRRVVRGFHEDSYPEFIDFLKTLTQ